MTLSEEVKQHEVVKSTAEESLRALTEIETYAKSLKANAAQLELAVQALRKGLHIND